MKRRFRHAVLLLATALAAGAHARDNGLLAGLETLARSHTSSAPAGAAIEVGFSPEAGAEQLVLKAINSAQREIRLQAYTFTSAPITRALLAARNRGVDIALVADHEENVKKDTHGAARRALSALATAGVRIRTIDAYPIHHDKILVVDRLHVETGSFNFSDAAARRNSENVLVLWNNPDLARAYLQHWESRFAQGRDFRPGY